MTRLKTMDVDRLIEAFIEGYRLKGKEVNDAVTRMD